MMPGPIVIIVEHARGEIRPAAYELMTLASMIRETNRAEIRAVGIKKIIQPDPLGQLIEENDNIDADDCVVDNRVIFSWDGVTQGNHLNPLELLKIQYVCCGFTPAGSRMSNQKPKYGNPKRKKQELNDNA